MTDEAGRRLYISGLACQGSVDEGKCAEIVKDLVRIIGMNSDGLHAAVWHFPAFDKGGEGFTYMQPIVESFIAADKWKFLSGNEGIYFVIVSCRSYWDKFDAIFSLFDILGTETDGRCVLVDFDTMILSMDNGAARIGRD